MACGTILLFRTKRIAVGREVLPDCTQATRYSKASSGGFNTDSSISQIWTVASHHVGWTVPQSNLGITIPDWKLDFSFSMTRIFNWSFISSSSDMRFFIHDTYRASNSFVYKSAWQTQPHQNNKCQQNRLELRRWFRYYDDLLRGARFIEHWQALKSYFYCPML